MVSFRLTAWEMLVDVCGVKGSAERSPFLIWSHESKGNLKLNWDKVIANDFICVLKDSWIWSGKVIKDLWLGRWNWKIFISNQLIEILWLQALLVQMNFCLLVFLKLEGSRTPSGDFSSICEEMGLFGSLTLLSHTTYWLIDRTTGRLRYASNAFTVVYLVKWKTGWGLGGVGENHSADILWKRWFKKWRL